MPCVNLIQQFYEVSLKYKIIRVVHSHLTKHLYETIIFMSTFIELKPKQNRAINLINRSLVPRPEEEGEKGPGFSRLRMRLIAVEFHRLRILLKYFCTLVTPILILTVTLHVRILIIAAYGMQRNSLDRTHPAADLKL